ncbi:MAG TPA: hypothetical protein VGB59_06675 [Allosphingosinicella sp.]|jgi:hypothetical protein
MKIDWPSVAIGVLTAIVSGLVIAWATPRLQGTDPQDLELAYLTETVRVDESPAKPPSGDEGREFISYIYLYNPNKTMVSNIEITLDTQADPGQISWIRQGRNFGAVLDGTLNPSSIDGNGLLRLRYARLKGGATHTILLRGKGFFYPLDPTSSNPNVKFSDVRNLSVEIIAARKRLTIYYWMLIGVGLVTLLWVALSLLQEAKKPGDSDDGEPTA